MLTVLANRTYRNLLAAQVIALVGTGLATVALGLLAYDIAGADAGAAWLAGDFCAQTGIGAVEANATSVTTAAVATEWMLRWAAQRRWLSIRGTHCHKQPIIGTTTSFGPP